MPASETENTRDIRETLTDLDSGDWVRFNDRTNPLKITDGHGDKPTVDIVGTGGGEYRLTCDPDPRRINYPSSGGQQSAVLRSVEPVGPDDSIEDADTGNAMRRLLSSLQNGDRIRIQGAHFDTQFNVANTSKNGRISSGSYVIKFIDDNPLKTLPRLYTRNKNVSSMGYRSLESEGVIHRLTVYYDGGGKITLETNN